MKTILVLAPHTDDGELAMGGTIARHVMEGDIVHHISFSNAAKSLIQRKLPPDMLVKENKLALDILGVFHQEIYEFELRTFSYHRQEILDLMIVLKNRIKPDIIYCPSINDLHQDHKVIADEALRCFKNNTIYCYGLIWNHMAFRLEHFVQINEVQLTLKLKAIKQYISQENRWYVQNAEKLFRSEAFKFGRLVNMEYAEVFEHVRSVRFMGEN